MLFVWSCLLCERFIDKHYISITVLIVTLGAVQNLGGMCVKFIHECSIYLILLGACLSHPKSAWTFQNLAKSGKMWFNALKIVFDGKGLLQSSKVNWHDSQQT